MNDKLGPIKESSWGPASKILSNSVRGEAAVAAQTRDAFLKLAGDSNILRQAGEAFFNHFVNRYRLVTGQVNKIDWKTYEPTRDRTLELINENQQIYQA